MKKTGMNKMRGMSGGKGTKAKKAKVMKKRSGMKNVVQKGRGKKTEMKVENFKDMMFKKFGGKT